MPPALSAGCPSSMRRRRALLSANRTLDWGQQPQEGQEPREVLVYQFLYVPGIDIVSTGHVLEQLGEDVGQFRLLANGLYYWTPPVYTSFPDCSIVIIIMVKICCRRHWHVTSNWAGVTCRCRPIPTRDRGGQACTLPASVTTSVGGIAPPDR